MWIIFSLSSALIGSVRNILSRYLILSINEYLIMWSSLFFGFLVSCLLVIWLGFNIQTPEFWKFTLTRVAIDTVGIITFFKALKCRAVSYVIPLTSISAVLTVGSAFLINHQVPSMLGLTGIVILSLASLLLIISEADFKDRKNNRDLAKATFLIAITVIVWTIADPLNSEGVKRSNPQTYFFVSYLLFSLIFTFIVLIAARKDFKKLFHNKKLFAVNTSIGLMLGFERILFLTALAGALTAYVVAISRLNIVFTALLAYLFLKEKINLTKLIGILLAFGGVVLLTLA